MQTETSSPSSSSSAAAAATAAAMAAKNLISLGLDFMTSCAQVRHASPLGTLNSVG
jgi:hypothetical protein